MKILNASTKKVWKLSEFPTYFKSKELSVIKKILNLQIFQNIFVVATLSQF